MGKIILSIDKEIILNSGFSEFETYGTFVDNYFPNAYKHRMWFSRRDMTKYFGNIDNLREKDLEWLSKDYNAITFEDWYIYNEEYKKYVANQTLQNLCRPKRFFKYFHRIIRKYKCVNSSK